MVIRSCCGLNLSVATLDFFLCTSPRTHTHNTVTVPSRAFRGIAERKRRKREQEATALMERYCLMPLMSCVTALPKTHTHTHRVRQRRGGVLCCPMLLVVLWCVSPQIFKVQTLMLHTTHEELFPLLHTSLWSCDARFTKQKASSSLLI